MAIPELRVRPLHEADIPALAELGAASFGVDTSDEDAAGRWRARLAHPLATDPEGGFVAERDEEIVGVAHAIARERLWCLSLLAVRPDVQSGGVGRALLERALTYASASTDIGLIASSSDPRALRLYALSGFSVLPTVEASGILDRSALPRLSSDVRAAGSADLEALESISREVRGAPHTTEIEFALRGGAQLLRLGDRGFAVVDSGRVWLLVARDDEAASQLLWGSLAMVGTERPAVRWITGEQQWAIEIVVRAGLRLELYGALCVRGQAGTLRPYLPSAPFA